MKDKKKIIEEIKEEIENERQIENEKKNIEAMKRNIISSVSSIFKNLLPVWIAIYTIAFNIYNYDFFKNNEKISFDFIINQFFLFFYMLGVFYNISLFKYIKKANKNNELNEDIREKLFKLMLNFSGLLLVILAYYLFNKLFPKSYNI